MCQEINNYDPFIKEELPKAAGDWFRTVHGDSIFVVKNIYIFAVFDIETFIKYLSFDKMWILIVNLQFCV